MLYLHFDLYDNFLENPKFIHNPSVYFDSVWEEEWLESEFGRSVISEIDNIPLGDSVRRSLLESDMRVEDLCTGTKNLLLCKFTEGKLHSIARMGPNCYQFLTLAAMGKDIHMGCDIYVCFREEDFQGQMVCIANREVLVGDTRSLFSEVIEVLGEVIDNAGDSY